MENVSTVVLMVISGTSVWIRVARTALRETIQPAVTQQRTVKMDAFLVGSCQTANSTALIASRIVRNARSTSIPPATTLCSATNAGQDTTETIRLVTVNLVTTV